MTQAEATYTAPDSLAIIRADSIAALKADSIAAGELREGIVLTNPAEELTKPVASPTGTDMSWVYVVLLALFCIISLRFRNNFKYISTLISNLTEVRERHNLFDDTVRESSFLLLLNIQWGLTAGVLLFYALGEIKNFSPPLPWNMPENPDIVAAIGICAGISLLYTLFMTLSYYIVGNVFSDSRHTESWVKGYTSSQGLVSMLYLPLALLAISTPQWREPILYIAFGIFILAKLIFIFKGFRIFFTQFSSWLLFLYYLCSLEIVPLAAVYLAANVLCSSVL